MKFFKTSIEIPSTEAGSIVSSDNSIWVDHGDDVKGKWSQKSGGCVTFIEKGVDEALEHMWGIGLTGVNPTGDYNVIFGRFALLANGEKGNLKPSKAFAKSGDRNIRMLLNLL